MAIKQLNDGRWICYYRIPADDAGKSRIKKQYFGRGPEAEAKARAFNEKLQLKRRRPVKSVSGPRVATLAGIYQNNKTFSANSAKMLQIRLSANILPFFGGRAAIDLTDSDIDNYIRHRRKSPVKNQAGKTIRIGVKDSTIVREITDLQAILNFAKNRRPPLIPFNPVAAYKKPKPVHAIVAPPSDTEIAKILAAASAHVIRAIKISCYIGLRPGAVELLSLVWNDVNWPAQTILIRSAAKGGPQQRHVAIHEAFLSELNRWYVDDKKRGPIVHYHGQAIKKFDKAWKGTLKRAGITRRIRPYDLRHQFITQALENGADLKALSEIVGSQPMTITKFYQHVSTSLHRDTIAKIRPL